ncbi:hypothetical protein [Nocardioides dongkuii]|uniref:hypothetical protein n=1 Tax=Nocardioides dongkuii TaxID=2760089 RepID=UPI0015FC51FF|nr:hypothetical protein [Nocardioides dongkuii]
MDPSKPPGDRTLAEAVAFRLEPPYEIDDQQRGVALVRAFADDALTGEYRFARWETTGGWYMEAAEECK